MQVTKLICPTCAAKIQIARVLPRGAKGKCPRCGTIFAVPDPEEVRAPATMSARPQLVDEEDERGEGRRRKRRRKEAPSGTRSYTALIIAIVLVLGFVGVLGWVFYDAAFAPYRNTEKIIFPSALQHQSAPNN
jgi:hypothetical protein